MARPYGRPWQGVEFADFGARGLARMEKWLGDLQGSGFL